MVEMFGDLNNNAVRHIKIGSTYGPPIRPHNAIGQGDVFCMLVAVVNVTIQFRYINSCAPQVALSAVVDDRAFRGKYDDVLAAVNAVMEFDATAGHVTNPKKLAFLAQLLMSVVGAPP